MSRIISCRETEQAVIERRQTATRRLGWWLDRYGRHIVRPGDQLTIVRQAMGRRRADGTLLPLVRLAQVELTDVYRERLLDMPPSDIDAEGVDPAKWQPYPGTPVQAWAAWFAATMGCQITDEVTVLRWRYIVPASPARCDGLAWNHAAEAVA